MRKSLSVFLVLSMWATLSLIVIFLMDIIEGNTFTMGLLISFITLVLIDTLYDSKK